MDLGERITFLFIGAVVGFIVGYIFRYLQTIEEEVHQVKDTTDRLKRDERGSFQMPNQRQHRPQGQRTDHGKISTGQLYGVAMALIVVMVAASAFASGRAALESRKATARQNQISACTVTSFGNLLETVNERTIYTRDQLKSNLDLQKSQSEFIATLVAVPPEKESIQAGFLRDYFRRLTEFIEVNGKALSKTETNPYPTVEEYQTCLDRVNQE